MWLTAWMPPPCGAISSAVPPAASTASRGCVYSTSSTPSVARKATRLPCSSFMDEVFPAGCGLLPVGGHFLARLDAGWLTGHLRVVRWVGHLAAFGLVPLEQGLDAV